MPRNNPIPNNIPYEFNNTDTIISYFLTMISYVVIPLKYPPIDYPAIDFPQLPSTAFLL